MSAGRIFDIADNNLAVIAKSAGNGDGTTVGSVNDILGNPAGSDYLSLVLIDSIANNGSISTIFAGALDTNGTASNPANLAAYSNVASSDHHLLVVRVE